MAEEREPLLRGEAEDKKFTPQQLAELESYFRSRAGLYEIASGYQTRNHGRAEWSLTTDELQGIHIYEKGNMKIGSNVSMEIVTGFNSNEKTGQLLVQCKNGDVVIEAPNGNLILRGKNVMINGQDAKGAVTINSPRNIEISAPAITQTTGSATMSMSGSSMSCSASDASIYGHNSSTVSEGVSGVVDGSLLQKIISGIEQIKMFFKSICG